MQKMTMAELDAQSVEMLPNKETLWFDDWAAVYASNTSVALNAATLFSSASSAAGQSINIYQ